MCIQTLNLNADRIKIMKKLGGFSHHQIKYLGIVFRSVALTKALAWIWNWVAYTVATPQGWVKCREQNSLCCTYCDFFR